jgi:hypothetical protein
MNELKNDILAAALMLGIVLLVAFIVHAALK